MAKKEVAKSSSGSKVKKVFMTIAIAIILAFFIGYAVNTFYQEPKWDEFCKPRLYDVQLDTKAQCEAVGGNWTDIPEVVAQEKMAQSSPVMSVIDNNQLICTKQPTTKDGELLLSCVSQNQTKQTGWCDPEFICRTEFEKALESHNRISFILLAIIGIIIIAVATIILRDNVIGFGMLAGGILTLLYGTMRFWGSIPDKGRLAILGVVLVTLIIIAWKRLVKE